MRRVTTHLDISNTMETQSSLNIVYKPLYGNLLKMLSSPFKNIWSFSMNNIKNIKDTFRKAHTKLTGDKTEVKR